ncbi:MAG: hypothetical protein GC154_14090 [bacterium]|nr:hypothetical protein [bacterium]
MTRVNPPHQSTDFQKEYNAARETCAIFALNGWGVIQLTGGDRKPFLHGLISNEVKALSQGDGRYALMLTAKGKIIADLYVFDRGDDLLVITPAETAQTLFQTFDKYLFTEDAQLHDLTSNQCVIALQGPAMETAAAKAFGDSAIPERDFGIRSSGGISIARVSLTGAPGLLIAAPRDEAEDVLRKLNDAGATQASAETLETLRIEAGIPRIGYELTDSVIPQEAGLYQAISFEKGCYIGQEVVARLHFRGHVNRELAGFTLDGDDAPSCPATVKHEDKETGVITSVCWSPASGGWIGLGYLRCALRKAGNEMAVIDQSGNVFKARVADIPFSQTKGAV